MKLFIVLLAIASLAYATDVPILRNDQHISPDGDFSFAYETGDGISHSANGNVDSVHGNAKYTAPEGEPIEITYVADKDGYRPTGSYIHPVPDYIVKAIEYIRAHPPQGLNEGAYEP